MSKQTTKQRLYPHITINLTASPSRFYALPLIGGIIKIIMIIPIFIELEIVSFASNILILVNSLAVLFTGRYFTIAYELALGLIRLNAKIMFFFFGLTSKYPGFSLSITPGFTLDLAYPIKPNRFFAFPLIGGIIRFLLFIPYLIYSIVIEYAAFLGAIIGSFYVLFTGKYPESVYQLVVDTVRINSSIIAYLLGISDTYPTFRISMNHRVIKILLLISAVILLAGRVYNVSQIANRRHRTYPNQYHIQNPRHRPPYFY